MDDLLAEVDRFQLWADALPAGSRSGEWECDYDHWQALHGAALQFLRTRTVESWTDAETRALLYAIARDNEIEYLARTVAKEHRTMLSTLARSSLVVGEPDARWQLAEQMGRVSQIGGPEEELLLVMVEDDDEYVRRRALGALARMGSMHTSECVLRQWDRQDPNQEWARMMCLWSLHRVGSPLLNRFLTIAEQDPRANLSGYAKRVSRGDVDP
jgi:hypothetical protein